MAIGHRYVKVYQRVKVVYKSILVDGLNPSEKYKSHLGWLQLTTNINGKIQIMFQSPPPNLYNWWNVPTTALAVCTSYFQAGIHPLKLHRFSFVNHSHVAARGLPPNHQYYSHVFKILFKCKYQINWYTIVNSKNEISHKYWKSIFIQSFIYVPA